MSYNLADLFELVVDAKPDSEAIVTATRRLTYSQLDERANRLAHHLLAAGVGPGDHVGLQLLNGTEYIEAMLAAFKIRAVPINVNYRYVERELRHLFDDADLVALVYHRQFADRIGAVLADVPTLRHLIAVDDGGDDAPVAGSVAYEDALAGQSPGRGFGPRSDDDIYCAYTGGTTGMPKGVMWRHEDIFFAALGGGDPMQSGNPIKAPEELPSRLMEPGLVNLPTPPFMHVSAHWGVFIGFYSGGKIVVAPPGPFDPRAIWELVGREKVNVLTIVGDAMARPLCDLLSAEPEAFDTSSMIVVGSGGAILSPAMKKELQSLLPNIMMVDGYGASETGTLGTQATFAGGATGGGPRFSVNDQTAVLDDDLHPVAPGSGVVGRLARRGHIPLGYYNDETKTKATFVELDGVRWVLPGDMATVEEDGTVILLGRGSVSINTGGEKVYPEEVESALKAHPAVFDAVVVGVPDERWGAKVVAVVEARPGQQPTLEELQAHCREELAGYKVPREVCLVDHMVRSPSGKADYTWARALAVKRLV